MPACCACFPPATSFSPPQSSPNQSQPSPHTSGSTSPEPTHTSIIAFPPQAHLPSTPDYAQRDPCSNSLHPAPCTTPAPAPAHPFPPLFSHPSPGSNDPRSHTHTHTHLSPTTHVKAPSFHLPALPLTDGLLASLQWRPITLFLHQPYAIRHP